MKKWNMKLIIGFVVGFSFLSIIISLMIKHNSNIMLKEPISISDGLTIISTDEYNGPYFEDGTDEDVTGIQMIVLENTSKEDLQYAEIIVEYENTVAEYAVTNLPAGEKALILEKNRMKFTDKEIENVSIKNIVFLEKMLLYEDLFEIKGLEGVVNIRNISDIDINGDIYVYYKNVENSLYLGGITYRIKVEQGLKAGEIRQLIANHYNNSSEIVMVSYVE